MISVINANIDALYAGSVRIKIRYFFSEKFYKWCVTKVAHFILLKKHNLHLSRLFCCNRTCYCVNMVSVMSASRSKTSAARYITSGLRYHPRYQSRSSMYIRGLIPQNFAVLAEAVLIVFHNVCLDT